MVSSDRYATDQHHHAAPSSRTYPYHCISAAAKHQQEKSTTSTLPLVTASGTTLVTSVSGKLPSVYKLYHLSHPLLHLGQLSRIRPVQPTRCDPTRLPCRELYQQQKAELLQRRQLEADGQQQRQPQQQQTELTAGAAAAADDQQQLQSALGQLQIPTSESFVATRTAVEVCVERSAAAVTVSPELPVMAAAIRQLRALLVRLAFFRTTPLLQWLRQVANYLLVCAHAQAYPAVHVYTLLMTSPMLGFVLQPLQLPSPTGTISTLPSATTTSMVESPVGGLAGSNTQLMLAEPSSKVCTAAL